MFNRPIKGFIGAFASEGLAPHSSSPSVFKGLAVNKHFLNTIELFRGAELDA